MPSSTSLIADEVVGIAQVKFGENGGPLEQFKGSGDEWQWVLYSVFIKSSVVNAGSQCLVLLLNKEKPCSCRR